MACGRCGAQKPVVAPQPQRRPSTVGATPVGRPLPNTPGVTPVRDAINRLRYVPK